MQLGVDALARQAPHLRGRRAPDRRGGGVRRAHRLRGAHRAPPAPHDAGTGQPRARARGGSSAARLFLLVADTLARNIVAPAELSVGVITAFCGAPFFVYLLRARRVPGAAVTPLARGAGRWTSPIRPRESGPGPPSRIRDLSFAVARGGDLRRDRPQRLGQDHADPPALARARARTAARSGSRREPWRASRAAEATRAVAVVPQDVPAGFPFTVDELVLMGRFPHGPRRFFETREDRRSPAEAMDRRRRGGAGAPSPCDRLAGASASESSWRARSAQRPRLLVLDEPTAHLDLRYQAECVALLRRLQPGRPRSPWSWCRTISSSPAEVCRSAPAHAAGAGRARGPARGGAGGSGCSTPCTAAGWRWTSTRSAGGRACTSSGPTPEGGERPARARRDAPRLKGSRCRPGHPGGIRHGPATVSGEPAPDRPTKGSHWERSREGRGQRDDPRVRRPVRGTRTTLSREKERSCGMCSFVWCVGRADPRPGAPGRRTRTEAKRVDPVVVTATTVDTPVSELGAPGQRGPRRGLQDVSVPHGRRAPADAARRRRPAARAATARPRA